MVEIVGLTKRYKKKTVLNQFSLKMKNKVYGILGPNGSGKTTLVQILTGILPANEGTFYIFDLNGQKLSTSSHQIGYLPQKFGALKELSVWDQMKYFANLKKIDQKNQQKEIDRVLDIVNLSDKKREKCGKISGGMIRRLGIAQAIMGDMHLLIFDEPTTGLDPEERLRFKNIIQELDKKCPILLSTHIVEDIEAVCDEIIIIYQGEILDVMKNQELTEIVYGKVFQVPISESYHIPEGYYLERYLDGEDGRKWARILAIRDNAEVLKDGKEVSPTIEDGYMYMIKKRGN